MSKFLFILLSITFLLIIGCSKKEAEKKQFKKIEIELTPQIASNFAQLALSCVQKEYPNKLDHVMNNAGEVLSPRQLHPAFYGCYDWHSSVHGHWMLVQLLKLFPDLPEAGQICGVLNENLASANIEMEVKYLNQPSRKSFERTYGWAWLLKLAEELHTWQDPDGQRWSRNLAPLAQAIVDRYLDFLPRQTYPIRTGVHPNTAFGIAFALDYARAVGDNKLETMFVERSLSYFKNDKEYPAAWEPGGEDFFSPSLMEADLMRRVLAEQEFREWFYRFLPDLIAGEPKSLLEAATVSDRSDPKIVHLDGLNLSRAWCMFGIAAALREDDAGRGILVDTAILHAEDALKNVASGNYEGEHWLASFAVYMLSMAEKLR